MSGVVNVTVTMAASGWSGSIRGSPWHSAGSRYRGNTPDKNPQVPRSGSEPIGLQPLMTSPERLLNSINLSIYHVNVTQIPAWVDTFPRWGPAPEATCLYRDSPIRSQPAVTDSLDRMGDNHNTMNWKPGTPHGDGLRQSSRLDQVM